MPRTVPASALALTAALLAVPAAPAVAAGGFTAPADVGPGGPPSYGFGVPATGPSGEIAVLAIRTQAHSRASAVVLRRTRADGTLGSPLVLSRSSYGSSEPALSIRSDGDAVAAWLAYVPGSTSRSGNRRVRAARVAPGTRSGSATVRSLSGGGSSAYSPTFVSVLPGPLLTWSLRTGPLGSTRWTSRDTVTTGPSALPLTGVQLPIPVAGDGDRRVVAAVGSRALRIAVSTDAARSFGPANAVDGSVGVIGRVTVSVDRQGLGAAAWLDRSPTGGPSRVLATVVGPQASDPAPAVVLDTPATAPAPPLVAAQSDGALIGWTVTERRAPLADSSPGVMRIARLGAAGTADGASVPLGGPGERGRLAGLVGRVGDRAQAFWVTPSGALRSQVIGATGHPGRAVTLDRGVEWSSIGAAGSGTSRRR
jgi:hypothetical protein